MTARRLGGTDVGPVIALYRPAVAAELAKYATASDVWMRLCFGIERPRSPVMQRGIDAEPRLRKAYVDAYGAQLYERPAKWIVQHPRHEWASVSPDDLAVLPGGGAQAVLVEYKSTSIFARHKYGDAETDAVPYPYQLQVQWGLEILDLPTAHLFVGFGRDFKENDTHQFLYEETRRFIIRRDRELAALCVDLCQRFINEHVVLAKPPSIPPAHNKRAFSRLLKEAAHGNAEQR